MLFFSLSPRIKHANIVSLEDIFESKSHLYLVMQLWVIGINTIFSVVPYFHAFHIEYVSQPTKNYQKLSSCAAAMCWLPLLVPFRKLIHFRDLKALQVQLAFMVN